MIYTDNDTAIALGIIEKVNVILKAKKRKLVTFLSNSWLLYVILSLSPSLIMYLIYQNTMNIITGTFLIVLVIMVDGILIFGRGKLFGGNIIFFKTKKDQPDFWTRNKDQILVVLVTSAIIIPITAVVTTIVTEMLSK